MRERVPGRAQRSTSITKLSAILGLIAIPILFQAGPACAQGTSGSTPTTPSDSTSLTNTKGSDLVLDFGQNSVLNISGNLSNFGTIYAISTNPKVSTATINAANVFNQPGGLITTVIPSSGLAGVSYAVSNLNLTFNTVHNFVNAGVVSSAGNLNVNAGGTIVNALPTGVTGPSPVMQALNNVNLTTMLGNLTNGGNIQALTGNIAIASAINQDLIINNLGGILQALGQVTVRDSSYSGKANLAILSGDVLAESLNLNSGCGSAVVNARDISAVVNIVASEAHIAVSSPNLRLGNIQLGGDPTFYNLLGDVVVNTDLVFPGQPVLIVASGNIVTGTGAGRIDTSSPSGGGDITMIAGANFTVSASTPNNPFAPISMTINGPSSTGGVVDLSGYNTGSTPISSLNSSSSQGNGGNITLIAYATSGLASQGLLAQGIYLPCALNARVDGQSDLTVTSGGGPGGSNGNVLLATSYTPPGSSTASGNIAIGNVDTRGGISGTGDITIEGFAPNLSGPAYVPVTISNTKVNPNDFTNSWSNQPTSSTSCGDLLCNGANITVKSDFALTGSLIADSTTGKGGNIQFSTSLLTVGPTFYQVFNGYVFIDKTYNLAVSASGTSGGTISLSTASNALGLTTTDLSVSDSFISVSASNGNGGSISLNSTANIIFTGSGLSVAGTGANGNAGTIALNCAGNIQTTSAFTLDASGAGTGNGGTVQVTSTASLPLGAGAGQFNINATSGTTSGNGGTFSLTAQGLQTIDSNFVNLSPLGSEGNGGNLSVISSQVFCASNIDVGGVGHGNGGSVTITSSSSPGDFIVGSAAVDNGVQGYVHADSGSLGGSGGSIVLSAPSNVIVSTVNSVSVQAVNGNGGTLSLTSQTGTLTLPLGIFSVDGTGTNSNGGTLTLSGQSLDVGGGAVSLSACSTGSGNGGSITLFDAQGALTSGKTPGQFSAKANGGSLNAVSGNGGTINISASSLIVDPADIDVSPLGQNGDGGNISLTATTSLFVQNSLQENGVGAGNGGSITISTQAASTFVIGSGVTSDGVNGTLQASSGTTGAGGSVSVTATQLNTNGAALIVNNLSDISAAGNKGKGGSITLSSLLTLGAGTLSANGTGLHGNGGKISLVVGAGGTLTGAVDLQANASGDGNGGEIDISGGVIGSGFFTINATGGSASSNAGNGGKAIINGTVADASSINLMPLGVNGAGGQVDLIGSMFTGNLDVSGAGTGRGGQVTISTMDNTPGANIVTMGPGATGSNYYNGTITANGGDNAGAGGKITVSLTGLANELILLPNAFSVASTNGAGGSISIQATTGQFGAAGSNSIVDLSGSTLSAEGAGPGGSITIAAGSIQNSSATPAIVSANGGNTGNGGSLNLITDLIGSNIQFSATSGPQGGNGGALSISSISGSPTIDMSAFNLGPLGPTGNGANYTFFSGNNLVILGDINANAQGMGTGGQVSITYGSITPFPLILSDTFTVGGPAIAGMSGVSGSILANGAGGNPAGTITIANQNPVLMNENIVVNSQISATPGSSGGTIIFGNNSYNYAFSLTGPGLVSGSISLQATPGQGALSLAGNVNVNLPSQPSVDIGQIFIYQGNLVISQPQINLAAGSYLLNEEGIVSLFTSQLNNNGVIGSLFGPVQLTLIQSNTNLTVAGTGVLVGNVSFVSNGSINVQQSGLLNGQYTATAPGLISVNFTPAVSTSDVLNAANGLLGGTNGHGSNLTDIPSTSFTNVSSSVISTDTLGRSLSFGSDSSDGDSGVVKMGNRIVVAYSNQALSLFVASDNSLEFAEEGTEISEENGDTILCAGKLVVNTNSKACTVKTRQGDVTISPYSTAMVRVSGEGTVRAISLSGDGTYTPQAGPQDEFLSSMIHFQQGEELLANNAGLDEEELISTDGIERGEALPVSITKTSRVALKRSISLRQFIDKDIMINGSLIHIRGASSKQYKAYVEKLRKSAYAQPPLRSIAYVQSLGTNMRPPVKLKEKDNLVLSSPNAKFHQLRNNFVRLDSGTIFVQAKDASVIRTRDCTIVLKKGTCVEVRCDSLGKSVVRVCSGVNSVTVSPEESPSAFGERPCWGLNGGEELVISRQPIKEIDVYRLDGVGHRNCVTSKSLRYSISHAEFSIPSLLSKQPHLHAILFPGNGDERSAREKVLKTAVAVQMIRGRQGAYSAGSHP